MSPQSIVRAFADLAWNAIGIPCLRFLRNAMASHAHPDDLGRRAIADRPEQLAEALSILEADRYRYLNVPHKLLLDRLVKALDNADAPTRKK